MRGPVFYRFGPFELDAASGQIFRQGTRISLPDSQRDILKYMVVRAGEAISKEVLMEAAWGGTNVEPNSLNRAISRLRKTLGGGREDAYIETVTGYGYRFVARVERCERDSTRADLAAELSPFRAFAEARTEIYSLDRTAIQRARESSEAALRRAPDFAQAHARFALVCGLLFEASSVDAQPDTTILEVGLQHAREACELLPDSAEARSTYAYLLHLRGEKKDAPAAAYRAMDLDPEDWLNALFTAYVNWGEERLRAARHVLKRCPGLAVGHWLMTTVHIARGALTLALEEARLGCAAQDAQPPGVGLPGVGLHLLLGLILAALNDLPAAEAELRRELESADSGHLFARECAANTWYALGAVLLRQGKEAEADAAFARALTIAPRHVSAAAALRVELPSSQDRPAASAPGEGGDYAREMDMALGQTIVLARAGHHAEAARTYRDAVAQAPPGFAGWMLPVEPLLTPLAHDGIWREALALVRARAL